MIQRGIAAHRYQGTFSWLSVLFVLLFVSALALAVTDRFDPAPLRAARNRYVTFVAGVQQSIAGVAQSAASSAASQPGQLTPTELEAGLLDRVNADRAANGVRSLTLDPALLPIARARAAAQAPSPSLSHYTQDGKLAFVGLLSDAGVYYWLAGENLARLGGPDATCAARAEDALMHSATHRANILEPTFNRVAVGAYVDDQGRVIFAQIFRYL